MAKSLARPKLSVVMSVYNGADYIKAALDSILGQTFTDFECIVIDDGSTDKTPTILKSYEDDRLKIITQTNLGLVASLNRGLSEARGDLIARHDADDISSLDRFTKQVSYLDAHKKVVIVGTSISVMDNMGKVLHEHHVLLNDPELRQELLVRSPFAHGSVMFRQAAIQEVGDYKSDYWPAEDYELWLRISLKGLLANIDDCLYTYREHAGSISTNQVETQVEKVKTIQALAWNQRNRLIQKQKIKLSDYEHLPDGNLRINRIISNIRYVSRLALKRKQYIYALKTFKLISTDPKAYRRMAGNLKRKLIR